MTHKLFGITGWKNSGKTTMTERLVQELTKRGYKISTVKHAHHNFDIDHVGTDSWRHRNAGASEVAIVSSARYAIMHENMGEEEPSLQAIVSKLAPCDLVLIEGYKRESHRKVELRRSGAKPCQLTVERYYYIQITESILWLNQLQ
jgi:molybdopterin-guanine dinucleotide biosynthesis protein B